MHNTGIMHLWDFIHQAADTYVDQFQSCRPEILYPQLVHDTPHNRNPEKYTGCPYLRVNWVEIWVVQRPQIQQNSLASLYAAVRQFEEHNVQVHYCAEFKGYQQ